MGQALYRKYRSKSLDEIVGQSHITDILRRSIASGNIAHAYLLTGPRGTGKTSIARILAHAINDLPYNEESTHLDIIEIDAASNNSVEDVRDLREKVRITPVSAKRKVYIIDEVHMLSKSAFNALLKTLEEPPEHVVFILATTDPDKLPATIISRVQRFSFRPIRQSDASLHLQTIAQAENIKIDDEAIDLIALHGNGSFRDSISLLDQLRNISDGQITRELIEKILGLAETETIKQLIESYEAQDLPTIVHQIDVAEANGTPAIVLAEQLIRYIRDHITNRPHLLTLLDKLLDVPRSSWPHIKLLTALASDIQTPIAPNKPLEPAKEAKPKEIDKPPIEKTTTKQIKKVEPIEQTVSAAVEFPWKDFINQLKKTSIGVHTILAQSTYIFDGSKLTIYSGRVFNKKQLDKSISAMCEVMQNLGIASPDISVLSTTKPPKDSQTAAIVAMMGGGEEVLVDG